MRVVVADDAVLLREGIASLLLDADFEVVGQAGTAEELLALVRKERPDLAIVEAFTIPMLVDHDVKEGL